ncbi:MAG TPA: ROK family protein [Methanomicrobiales archaeon]|nr:ROK family protein [Methanomicrobiales archaeon]
MGDEDRPVVAVDLGATTTRVALFGPGGKILAQNAAPTPSTGDSPEVIARRLATLIRRLLPSIPGSSPAALGISAAGPIDHRRGSIVRPPNLPFGEIPLADPLGEEFGLPVRLANDCHAGVLGEVVFGAGAGCPDLVYVTLSTGIGGGVVSNGRLVLGRDGNAAEIGHFHVDSSWNLPCGCGGTGHWEGYASGRFIPRFFGEWCRSSGLDPAGIDGSSAAGIFAAAGKGDRVALGFMEALGKINGRGISDVIVAYDPSRIILDGSVVLRNEDLVLAPLIAHVDRFLPLPEIRLTALDGLAPLYGASVLARGYDTVIGTLLPGEHPRRL